MDHREVTFSPFENDAELDSGEDEEGGSSPIFRVRWSHRLNGMPIETDYIEAPVNRALQRLFAMSWLRHTVRIGAIENGVKGSFIRSPLFFFKEGVDRKGFACYIALQHKQIGKNHDNSR